MSRSGVCIVAAMLVACASAGSWRDLRIDGNSVESFNSSVELFLEELPYARREQFSLALSDIWYTEVLRAAVNEGSFTETEFIVQLDGLGYDEVLAIADAEEPRVSDYYRGRSRYAGPPRGSMPEYGQPGMNGISILRGANGQIIPGGAN